MANTTGTARTAKTAKTLYLLRHAKAKRPSAGQRDADRALTGRGRRAAAALGRGAVAQGAVPELVVTSPALRALQTATGWAQAAGLPEDRVVRYDRLYQAHTGAVLAVIRSLDDEPQSVMLVGHNPTFSELAGELAGRFIDLRTCAMAVFAITGRWADAGAASAELLRVERPE